MLRNELLYPTACRRYLDERQSRLRSTHTRKGVLTVLTRLQAAHPDKRVNEFTEADLVAWLNHPDLAPTTVNRYRTVLTGFFKWATRQGLCETDPAAFLGEIIAPGNRPRRSPNWLEDDEIHDILTLPPADEIGLRDKVALALPIYTGLRVAEFTAPPRNQPDRGLTWGRVRRDTLKVLGKGFKWDTVGVAPQLASILAEWRAAYEAGLGRPVAIHDPVLCRAHDRIVAGGNPRDHERGIAWGKGLGTGGVRDLVARYGAPLGYDDLQPHDLRRTFAYALKRAGVPIEDISVMMRHENIGTTQRYLKHDKSALAGNWGKIGTAAAM